ncbi:protein disulfide-isomerase [Malassezia sp. CBS 17886]|nr:protein disulfide-isomerase [Malassezia sp. CBS 17886]
MRGLATWVSLAALAAVRAHAAASTQVTSLTQSLFHDWVNDESLALVEFFAPWCGHCQALEPHYEAAADELRAQQIKLAKVDCTAEEALCSEQQISGFPTLKVFRNGISSPYTGTRKQDGIVSYMTKQKLPAVSQVTPANLDELKSKDRFVVVAFVDEGDRASLDALHKFGEAHRDSVVLGVSHSKELADAHKAKFPALVAFRAFDEPEVVKQARGGALNDDEIEEFVGVESVPLIDEVSADNFMTYAQAGLPLAYYFVDPASPTRESEVKALADVARAFRGKINLVWIDAVKFVNHAKALNLHGESWPAFAVQDMTTGAKYPLNELRDIPKDVRSFLEKYSAGKLAPSIKSAPVPKSQSEPVVEVVADEFDKHVFDDARDVLLEMYAPWCGHCKRLAPTYTQLAQLYGDDPKHAQLVSVARMDGTANDLPPHAHLSVSGFPTILLKPAGKGERKFLEYDGDRTLESLIDFVATKGTHKVRAQEAAAHGEAAAPETASASTSADASATQAAHDEL